MGSSPCGGVDMLTVLIADDEKIERTFLRNLLEDRCDAYHVVAEAGDGEEAVRLARIHKPDVILMDINMPVHDGIEAARMIKEEDGNTIIILNSAYAEFDFARRALDVSLDAYLVKSAQEEDIISHIERCVQRRKIASLGKPLMEDEFSVTRYPFNLAEEIIQGIRKRQIGQLKVATDGFLNFLRLQDTRLEAFRLFIINTIFSIKRTLHEEHYPEVLISLLETSQCLQHISQLTFWHEIQAEVRHYFYRLIGVMEGMLENHQDSMKIILDHIDRKYGEDISLDDLSSLVHLSPTYISHLFHERTGTSFREYLKQKRMQRSCQLLAATDLSIKEIAEQCGYANISHFYRVFKSIIQVTPAEYRQQECEPHEYQPS